MDNIISTWKFKALQYLINEIQAAPKKHRNFLGNGNIPSLQGMADIFTWASSGTPQSLSFVSYILMGRC